MQTLHPKRCVERTATAAEEETMMRGGNREGFLSERVVEKEEISI
jgi:hypothetical protein